MTAEDLHYRIFKKGSKTYFHSSLFFPREVRKDVFILYAFVRTADDLVDCVPPLRGEFERFTARYGRAAAGEVVGDPIIDPFADLMNRKKIPTDWVEAFLRSMAMDLEKSSYDTYEEVWEYVYGSAEVIGLCMSRILDLPEKALPCACLLGRSMQYINFIRDIAEDNELGRRYLPLDGSPLSDLRPPCDERQTSAFQTFIRSQAGIYRGFQKEAERGYHLIPKRYLIPIKTASDMYNWTAEAIMKDPLIVFRRKVKPSRLRIVWTLFKNLFYRPSTP